MENSTKTGQKFTDIAPKRFLEGGYSCSESITQAAYELGLVPKELVSASTTFSGGMSSRCACGAVCASQLVLGYLHGKYKDNTARALAKEFYERFTSSHKVACCKVLSSGFDDFHGAERKKHCTNLVADCAKILDEMLEI